MISPARFLTQTSRFIDIEQALGKGNAFLGVGATPARGPHHAFIGLGRMAGQRQRVVAVNMAIHVGKLKIGLVDGGFERQAETPVQK